MRLCGTHQIRLTELKQGAGKLTNGAEIVFKGEKAKKGKK